MLWDRSDVFSCGAALAAASTVTCLMAAGSVHDSTGTSAGQEGSAQQVFTTVCGRCHPVERIVALRRTRTEWEETIDSMITARGAQITDQDFDTILSYLTQEYGRVDVNRAPAMDIAEVLSLTEELAGAIVAYRKEHGPFENFEALLRVPGVSREALEKKRDAITF